MTRFFTLKSVTEDAFGEVGRVLVQLWFKSSPINIITALFVFDAIRVYNITLTNGRKGNH